MDVQGFGGDYDYGDDDYDPDDDKQLDDLVDTEEKFVGGFNNAFEPFGDDYEGDFEGENFGSVDDRV